MVQIDLRNPFSFADMETWNPVFNQPAEAQKRIYADPAFRDAFREELKTAASVQRQMASGRSAGGLRTRRSSRWSARPSATSPRERGRDPLDTFLDLALEDDLNIQYTMAQYPTRRESGGLISDPRTMIGLSDGGAHVDMLCDAGYCTYLLGNWVRERQALTLEHAVKRITSEPADFFGIQRRGRLRAGLAADVAIFDYNTVGSAKRARDAARSAGRRTAPGDAGRGHRVHGRQRRGALRARPRKRRDAGAGAALGPVLSGWGVPRRRFSSGETMAICEYCKQERSDARSETYLKSGAYGRSTIAPPEEIMMRLCRKCFEKTSDPGSTEYQWLLDRGAVGRALDLSRFALKIEQFVAKMTACSASAT